MEIISAEEEELNERITSGLMLQPFPELGALIFIVRGFPPERPKFVRGLGQRCRQLWRLSRGSG